MKAPLSRGMTAPLESEILLAPGTLWERTVRQSERSLESGDREPLATELHRFEEAGASFAVHVAVGRDRKWKTTREQQARGVDPFLAPYTDDLFVADVTETHALLLNKFNVIDHHLLLVTRAFESQANALSAADFAALWVCMAEFDSLAFYNSAPEAGASQPHKHLQLVERAVLVAESSASGADLPVRRRLGAAGPGYAYARASVPVAVGAAPSEAGTRLEALYQQLLALAAVGGAPAAPSPYNLLLTHDAMVVIPRTRAGWDGMGINGMGYAGSLLLHRAEDFERLRATGPLAMLAHAGRSEPDTEQAR